MPSKPKEPSAKQLDLERYIPALVNFLSNKLSSGASVCYRKNFNVGVIEWRVLAMLKVESNISANRICQVIGLDKAAVSRALKQLQTLEHISFVKDEHDGRSSLAKLTLQGEKLHDEILTVALERERLLLHGVSEKEIDTLIDVLLKLNKNIKKVNEFEIPDTE
jgi:DNA-binding MarR family transcriptional regulator